MVGRRLGHYQILEKTGEGGMGVVYKARDTRLDRFVAVKVLPPDLVANPERKRRFTQEAKAASALNHPNIVTIHDIAEQDGVDYIVMEYIDGQPLGKRIPRGGMRLADALDCAAQVADALAKAHAAGIVHRDIKPANVLVTGPGRVKLLDFGLAKLTDPGEGSASDETRTQAGTILGTAAYMSPEQAEGKPVDARSDVFSFGALLYEMISGQRAFRGDSTASTLAAVLTQDPQPLSAGGRIFPPELERIIARCLRKDREKRVRHLEDIRLALLDLEEAEPAPAVRAKSRMPLLTLAAVAALAIAAAGWWYFRRAGEPLETAMQATPLTSYPGSELSPSFSPDGNQVAFAWDAERDNFDIYVKLIGSGDPLRLTRDPANDLSPAWSPDGRWIAFLRVLPGRKAGVFLVSPLGGAERKLSEIHSPGSGPGDLLPGPYVAWSRDSKWLVVAEREPAAEARSLFAVSVETSERRRLTSAPPTGLGDTSPSFSQDGRTLAFFRFASSGNGDLFLLDSSSEMQSKGAPKRLTFENRLGMSPVWSAGDKEIIFSSGAASGERSLWRMGISSGTKPVRIASIGEDSRAITLAQPSPGRPGRLVYVRQVEDLNIWRAGLIPERPPERIIASTRTEEHPEYSPDGRKITYRSTRSGDSEVWVCDADGANAVQVTAMGGCYNPRWSPDGEQIAFTSRPEGQADIYVVNANGGRPRRLTNHPASDSVPSWSRDGRWIYFASLRSGEMQVWKTPAGGGEAHQVTRHGGHYAGESADGQALYYLKHYTPAEVWQVPVEGGDETALSGIPAAAYFDIARHGIYFLPRIGPGSKVQFFRFADRTIQTLVTPPRPLSFGLSASPDGRWILFTQLDHSGSDLMLVENFR
ncbi:MAG: serine/threonine-protein kinase [Candidatus Solibacter usitatus]|nr:serine/threonine-protein kinase [Candidatus Solibacter usitatus]